MKYSIKATFVDCIDGIVHDKKGETTVPDYYLTKEIDLDDDNDKSEFIKLFKECISFSAKDEYVSFTVKRSDEEIANHKLDSKQSKEYGIRKLKNWYSKDANKEEITTHLIRQDLNWILDEIKK
jgi:hypothetical protein